MLVLKRWFRENNNSVIKISTKERIVAPSDFIKKYSNIYNLDTIKELMYDNIININAWNEWNEQAILEPNNITGYNNLNIINDIYNNL